MAPRIHVPLIVLLVLLFPPFFPTAGANPREAGRVVAAIDQRLITERDLDFWVLEERLTDPLLWEVPEEQLRPGLVTRAIDEILLADWAETQLEELPQQLLRERTRDMHQRYRDAAGGDEPLRGYLEDSGLEPEELQEWLERRARHRLLIEQAISSRLPVGLEDALEGSARDAARMQVANLMVRVGGNREAAWERALEIRRQIAGGLTFPQAVRLYSDDELARMTGGDLGWLIPDELAPPLWDAAAKLRRGEVTLPVYWQGAFHIVQLVDYETERQRAFFSALRREELIRLHEQRGIRRIRLAAGYELEPLPEIPQP